MVMRKYVIVGVVIVALIFLIILLLYTQTDSKPISQNPTPQAYQIAPGTAETVSKPQRKVPSSDHMVMDGTGNFLSSAFKLSEGILVLELTNSNAGKFVITLLPEKTSNKIIIVNTDKKYIGIHAQPIHSTARHIPGIYEIRVESDGHWRLDMKQTNWGDGDELPLSASGNGNWVSKPINLRSGKVQLSATNESSKDFSAYIVKHNGEIQHPFVTNTAEKNISTKITINKNNDHGLTPDIYVLVIKSAGNWEINLTQ